MMKRIVVSLLLLALVALLADPVFAGEGDDQPRDLRISINPFFGDVGTQVVVTGSGADPTKSVFVSLSPRADSAEGALETVEFGSESNGQFQVTLTVPDTVIDGRYFIRAEQFTDTGGVLHYYYNVLTIGDGGGPLLPETGIVPGTSLTVTAALAMLLLLSMVFRGIYTVRLRK